MRRRVLAVGFEAESLEDGAGPRLGGVGVDIGEPCIDLRDPVGIGHRLCFLEQGGALGVGRQHDVEYGNIARRRFLRYGADARLLDQIDAAAVDGNMPLDQMKQGGLAGAVLADKAGLAAGRQRHRRALEQFAALDAIGEVVDSQHGRGRSGR